MEHFHEFDLNQDPFQNEPDLRFFFASPTHRRAKLRVDRALRQSKGLVVLAGEGGTGKSLLARSIFEELEEEMFESSLMVMMQGTADAVSVLRRFSAQLGTEDPPTDRAELLALLYDQLAIVREDGRHAVLIIDDAQVLGHEAMTEIAGLLSFEYEDRRLISLLLVGAPELDDIVASVPSLGERVDVRVRLDALSEGEAAAYLAHRIQVAGGNPEIFEASAIKAIYTFGRGRPRRMNTLADNALFEAFLSGHKQVSEDDVHRASDDLPFVAAAPGFAMHRQAADVPAPEGEPASLFDGGSNFESPPSFEREAPLHAEPTPAFDAAGETFATPPARAEQTIVQQDPFGMEPDASPVREDEPAHEDPFGTTLDDIDDAELHLDVPVGFDESSVEPASEPAAIGFDEPAAEGFSASQAMSFTDSPDLETEMPAFGDVEFGASERAQDASFDIEPRNRADAFEFGNEETDLPSGTPEPAAVDEFDDLFADLIDD